MTRPNSNSNSNSDHADGLSEYLSANGVELASVKVKISDKVPAGRGLVLTEDVEPEAIVLSLPPSSLFNVRTLFAHFHPSLLPSAHHAQDNFSLNVRPNGNGKQLVKDAKDVQGSSLPSSTSTSTSTSASASLLLSSPAAVSLSLALWRTARDRELAGAKKSRSGTPRSFSFHHMDKFFDTLPRTFGSVPLTWAVMLRVERERECEDDRELAQQDDKEMGRTRARARTYAALLDALPPPSRALLVDVERRFWADWNSADAICKSRPDLLRPPRHLQSAGISIANGVDPKCTVEDYLWAWLCVNSRCVYLPLNLSSHSNNFTLAPLLDMANHVSDPSREYKVRFTSSGGLELSAPAADVVHEGEGLCEGDEVFITYGAHSNATLLSEYGFVLPRDCTSEEALEREGDRGGKDDGQQPWRGNRYCDVDVSDEVEALFEQQGEEGVRKRELLEAQGYWRDWTIHPCPAPAHPSHRLVPALRLLAISLPASSAASTFDASVSSSASHPSKKRRTGKDKVNKSASANATSRQSEEIGTAKTAEEEGRRALERWQATLQGMAEIVDERNEADARQLLLRVCEQVEQRSRISLDRIQNQVNPMLAGLASAPEGEKRGKYEGEGFHARQEKNLKENEEVQSWSMEMQIAVGFVKQLVEEEEEIAQRVAYSVEQGVEF